MKIRLEGYIKGLLAASFYDSLPVLELDGDLLVAAEVCGDVDLAIITPSGFCHWAAFTLASLNFRITFFFSSCVLGRAKLSGRLRSKGLFLFSITCKFGNTLSIAGTTSRTSILPFVDAISILF